MALDVYYCAVIVVMVVPFRVGTLQINTRVAEAEKAKLGW